MTQIEKLLATRELTAGDIAGRTGMSRRAVYDRLRGRTRWGLAEAVDLADALGVSLDGLAGPLLDRRAV